MQVFLYEPKAVDQATRDGREAIDLLACLFVGSALILILIARSRLARHIKWQLLLNFLAILASAALPFGAIALIDRATNPIQMLEISYGMIIDTWPLTTMAITLAPLAIAYAVFLLVRWGYRRIRDSGSRRDAAYLRANH